MGTRSGSAYRAPATSRVVSYIDVGFNTDSTGQQNDSGGRVFQPALLRALRELAGRTGWPADVPDLRFVGSLDSSSGFAPPSRYVHDIVSGQTAQQARSDIATALNAIARAPKYYCFLLGANDTLTRTNAEILADLEALCAAVLAKWSGATIPVVITPKPNNSGGAVRVLADAVAAPGAIPSAGRIVDIRAFPYTTALAPDGIHPLGPDAYGTAAAWTTMSRTTNGPGWIAREILTQLLRPGLAVPMRSGE